MSLTRAPRHLEARVAVSRLWSDVDGHERAVQDAVHRVAARLKHIVVDLGTRHQVRNARTRRGVTLLREKGGRF